MRRLVPISLLLLAATLGCGKRRGLTGDAAAERPGDGGWATGDDRGTDADGREAVVDDPVRVELGITGPSTERTHVTPGGLVAGFDNRAARLAGKLVVDLGWDAGDYLPYLGLRGFHVVGVRTAACAGNADWTPDRHLPSRCRLNAFDGKIRGDQNGVKPDQSIVGQVFATLTAFAKSYPGEGWGHFLTDDGGGVEWSKVAFTGRGYGGDNAALFAHEVGVYRAVSRNGYGGNGCSVTNPVRDTFDPRSPPYDDPCSDAAIAGWLDVPSATPLDRYFGFVEKNSDPFASWLFAMERMDYVGEPVDLDVAAAPYGGSHRFYGTGEFEAHSDAVDVAFGVLPENRGGKVVRCTTGQKDTCETAKGARGACAPGTTTCLDERWGPCSIQPAARDTCDPGDDSDCDGEPNDAPCECLNGEHPCTDLPKIAGTCALGIATCAGGRWGACSIQPGRADTCVAGNDDTCDGQPNQGCASLCGGFTPPGSARTFDLAEAGVAIDLVTGLAWERGVTTTASTIDRALLSCSTSKLGGHDDWRLPTVIELMSIVAFARANPAIDGAVFPSTPADLFWTATAAAPQLGGWWFVWFDDGVGTIGGVPQVASVRCVRSTGTPAPRCHAAGARYAVASGLVTDALTGLVWQQRVSELIGTSGAARDYCAGQAGGFRVPTVPELATLVEYQADPLAGAATIDPIAFPNTPADTFWTSSATSRAGASRYVAFHSTAVGVPTEANTNLGYVRCVR